MNVSIIVITKNEVGSIERVLAEMPQLADAEVLVVDGRSTDGTPELVRRLGHRVIPEEGEGFGAAYRTGARRARGDVLVLTTGDGSQDPADIPRLLARLREGYPIVLASRYLPGAGSEDDTWLTYVGNRLFTGLGNLLYGLGISDILYTYVAIEKRVFEDLDLRCSGFGFCVELPIKAHWKGYRIGETPVRERRRYSGQKKVRPFVDGLKILATMLRLRAALLRPWSRRRGRRGD